MAKPKTSWLWKNVLSGLTQRERKRVRQLEYKALIKLGYKIKEELIKRSENKWQR